MGGCCSSGWTKAAHQERSEEPAASRYHENAKGLVTPESIKIN